MNDNELKKVLASHRLWLAGETDGVQANLREANLIWANLSGADLRRADLRWADLREANLSKADLREANLREANLIWANLSGADLRGANLDFTTFPLWCGSFDLIADDRLVWQLTAHLARLNTSLCSEDVQTAMAAIAPYADRFCEYRRDVKPLIEPQLEKEKT